MYLNERNRAASVTIARHSSFSIFTSRGQGERVLGASDNNGMLGDIEPFKVHCSQLHVFGCVAHYKVTIIA
jgi:hypothetical protein